MLSKITNPIALVFNYVFSLALLLVSLANHGQSSEPENPLAALAAKVPDAAADFSLQRTDGIVAAAPAVEAWAVELAEYRALTRPDDFIRRADELTKIQQTADALVNTTLEQRKEFAALPPGPERRELLRNYLRTMELLIDLAGRIRYLVFDALVQADYACTPDLAAYDRFLAMLAHRKSALGAAVTVAALFDPPPDDRPASRRASQAMKLRLLQLIAVSGNPTTLGAVAEFVAAPETPPELIIAGAAAIRRVGLPQVPRPGQDDSLPDPPITAGRLAELVRGATTKRLSPAWKKHGDELLAWLDARAQRGIEDDSYWMNTFDVQAGDWLLMRNPSPYNRFTDLSPGLFTHVGVITTETGSDGIRRMVLVDLPERGKQIRTTNLDVFVLRTLHYAVLRHEDPAVGKKMADVARTIIDNPSQFDLNFRTARVEALRGQPLDDREIHTYCAGLLLLCAQETEAPRSDFFPIPEFPAGGKTVENLDKLGLTFGEDFISPTGALFAPRLRVVGRQHATYEPGREVEEAIFDHFAAQLVETTLEPSPDLFQALRLKVAEAGKSNPLLARALAEAVGVNQSMDLVAAAKAAAVVETLDEVAQSNSAAFRYAFASLRAGPGERLREQGHHAQEIEAIEAYRKRHAELYQALIEGRLTPRQLRIALVEYYKDKGKRQMDQRYFQAADDAESTTEPTP